MTEAIYIQHGQALIRMEPNAYHCKDEFQELLEQFPDLLAGEQINRLNPRRWLFIEREVTPLDAAEGNSWSNSHLFLDQDAIPTLVEVTRENDARVRREIVSQLFAHAAHAIGNWPKETLSDRFIKTCQRRNVDPNALITDVLGTDQNTDRFWQTACSNLQNGKMRLVLVADVISPELQNMVEFLNQQMAPVEVLALEIRRYSGGDFATHIPRLVGHSVA